MPDNQSSHPIPPRPRPRGGTVWLTGLPSSGKSTVATAVADLLEARGREVEILDGDRIRAQLTADLGFSKDDRNENVRRIGWLSLLLARHGVTVLVPVIAPYESARQAVRERHAEAGTTYLEIHVATPTEVCAARDVKGLYARQARGELSGLTGVDDPYEAPVEPDLRLDTSSQTVADSAAAVDTLLRRHGLG
jgi:adenylylsulfate kinase